MYSFHFSRGIFVTRPRMCAAASVWYSRTDEVPMWMGAYAPSFSSAISSTEMSDAMAAVESWLSFVTARQ